MRICLILLHLNARLVFKNTGRFISMRENMSGFGSISIRYKLIFLCVFPALVAAGSVLLAGWTMTKQNNELNQAIVESEARQTRANSTLIALLQLQRDLQALIAADAKPDIRANAIATIQSLLHH